MDVAPGLLADRKVRTKEEIRRLRWSVRELPDRIAAHSFTSKEEMSHATNDDTLYRPPRAASLPSRLTPEASAVVSRNRARAPSAAPAGNARRAIAGYRAVRATLRHIELHRPGELVGMDCRYVGRLRDTAEAIWQLTAIDLRSSYEPTR